jgi:hypothetical protein
MFLFHVTTFYEHSLKAFYSCYTFNSVLLWNNNVFTFLEHVQEGKLLCYILFSSSVYTVKMGSSIHKIVLGFQPIPFFLEF